MPENGSSAEVAASEHSRQKQTRWPTPGLNWQSARTLRPLFGGLMATAIVVAFLAIRGGMSTESIDEITGTQRGGWNRLEDVHLLIVVNGAIGVGIAMALLAEFTRHWVAVYVAAMMGGVFLAVREIGDVGGAGGDALLGLTIASVTLAGAAMLYDLARFRRRAGY